jgi:hypothetical protein
MDDMSEADLRKLALQRNKKIKKLEEKFIDMVKQKKTLENTLKKQTNASALIAEHEKTIQEFEKDQQ